MVRALLLILAALGAVPAAAAAAAEGDFLVIAHRGASGERPEHTLAAYERAIDQGADYIEPDLVATKDMRLVARHETEIGETTDVGTREEFADRKRSKTIEGRLVTGWFAEDFTLAELRSLRVKERLPGLRPANARFDGLYQIPTFEEIVALVRAKEAETGRAIGIYPELKHPTWLLQEEGIDTVDLLATALRKADLDDADDRVFVQAFEIGPLQRLDALVESPLVLLIAPTGGPYDEPAMSWAEIMTPTGLAQVAIYADGIGPYLGHVLAADGSPTALIADAHAAGLQVHPWTLRKENAFLPPALRKGSDAAAPGDLAALVGMVVAAGADGVFTDDPALVLSALGR
jgi:glycerophosphoryl diester phosphodiesterase